MASERQITTAAISNHFILYKLATQSQIIEMDNQDNGTVSIHLSLLLSKPTSITCSSVKWQDEHRPCILINRHSPPFSHGLLVSTVMYLVHYSQLILTIPITRAITCNNQCNQCNQCNKDSRRIQAWSISYDLLRGSTMMLKEEGNCASLRSKQSLNHNHKPIRMGKLKGSP